MEHPISGSGGNIGCISEELVTCMLMRCMLTRCTAKRGVEVVEAH